MSSAEPPFGADPTEGRGSPEGPRGYRSRTIRLGSPLFLIQPARIERSVGEQEVDVPRTRVIAADTRSVAQALAQIQTADLRLRSGRLDEGLFLLGEARQHLVRALKREQPRQLSEEWALDPTEAHFPIRDLWAVADVRRAFVAPRLSLRRELPVTIYVDAAQERPTEVIDAVAQFCSAFGFQIVAEDEAKRGSWFQRFLARTSELFTVPEVRLRLRQAEHAVLTHGIQKQQSDIDKNQAEAAAALLESLASIPNAAIQIGSLLLIKTTDDVSGVRVFLRSLTLNEMVYLQENAHFLEQPRTVLRELSEYSKTDRQRKCLET